MTVKAAVFDEVIEFRCKDCHGPVKVHLKLIEGVSAPHIAHKSKADAASCAARVLLRQTPVVEPQLVPEVQPELNGAFDPALEAAPESVLAVSLN